MTQAQPKLGRRPSHDPRDLKYRMRSLLPPTSEIKRDWRYWWANGAWLNQANTGTCVGHGWAHYVEDGPITWPGTIDAFGIYREAVLLDPWSDNDFEATAPRDRLQFGTASRSGADVLRKRGIIDSYYHGYTLEELVYAVLALGPAGVGINWYGSFFHPDHRGRIDSISGGIQGGHFGVINGVNTQSEMFRFKNSWGRLWGNRGHAYIPFSFMDRLIREEADIIIAQETAP